jgi:hypothetical protein
MFGSTLIFIFHFFHNLKIMAAMMEFSITRHGRQLVDVAVIH